MTAADPPICRAFDLSSFNAGDYERAVREASEAENISAVLYPNDNFEVRGRTHRVTSGAELS